MAIDAAFHSNALVPLLNLTYSRISVTCTRHSACPNAGALVIVDRRIKDKSSQLQVMYNAFSNYIHRMPYQDAVLSANAHWNASSAPNNAPSTPRPKAVRYKFDFLLSSIIAKSDASFQYRIQKAHLEAIKRVLRARVIIGACSTRRHFTYGFGWHVTGWVPPTARFRYWHTRKVWYTTGFLRSFTGGLICPLETNNLRSPEGMVTSNSGIDGLNPAPPR